MYIIDDGCVDDFGAEHRSRYEATLGMVGSLAASPSPPGGEGLAARLVWYVTIYLCIRTHVRNNYVT